MTPKKSKLLHVYHVLVAEGSLPADPKLRSCLVKKSGKSESGVLVITVGDISPFIQSHVATWDCCMYPHVSLAGLHIW